MATTLNKQKILDTYANHLSSKGASRHAYMGYASEFLNYANGKYDRETISKFLDYMREKHGYNEDSMNLIFRVVRTVFKRNEIEFDKVGIEWPFNRGEAPIIRESEINAPALDPDTIREMIEEVIQSDYIEAAVMLALSTTYGLRREEMENIKNEDINFKDKTIYIATLKHGKERTHIIPDEIITYLKQYDFDTPRTNWIMINMWRDLEYMIHLKHINHVSWHSVRRTLATLLKDNFDPVTVRNFLRWKHGTSSDMLERYSATVFVGKKGTTRTVNSDARSVDEKIFSKDDNGNYIHPFLESWI